jgi:hypothetical protein
MALIILNEGGDFDVNATATTGTDLVVTINAGSKSISYTTAGAGTTTATAAAFVAQHGQSIADTWKMYVSSAVAVITFEGVSGATFGVTGGTLGSANPATELSIDADQIAQILVASATSLTLNMNANVTPAASDVITLAFISAADRKKFTNRYNAIKNASSGLIALDLACKATAA